MHKYRVALVVVGALLTSFGAFRLLTELDRPDLLALAVWLVVAVALHDFLIAPLTVGTGVLLTRIPAAVRRCAQAALIAGAMVTVIAIPLILREDTQPAAKATLQRDYAANLALLLGLVVLVSVVLYLARVLRPSHTTGGARPHERPGDG